ncbi:aminotransferase class I/II-fold pyridoxal phosphate-dependent enzyme [Puniceicoccaceae bacterium K14]|nr:aminotransferase class I/II-fold pyridoxal phosphate-dependent enzyme [Puniceicoccaceae bacterium K14]
MPAGQHIPLGQRIPNSIHAVSVSLPTMADVIGYEEKRPEVLDKIQSGYPRFVTHPFLLKIETYWKSLFDSPNSRIWLTSSEKIARSLQTHLGDERSKYLSHGGISGVRLPEDETPNQKAKLYLQHIGGLLSSRQAEDYLASNGIEQFSEKEERYQGDSEVLIKSILAPDLGNPSPDSILLANSGMNAFFAAYQAINKIQSAYGKKSWIKLGWLYTDTMRILDKLRPEGADNVNHYDIFDLDALEATLAQRPNDFAGIITETPTNPLVQTIDLKRVREIADRYGAFLIIDPTMNSIANIDVSPYADVIVTSLTKYVGYEGDTIAGSICVAERCPEKETLISETQNHLEPVYQGDLDRLAHLAQDYHQCISTINSSTEAVAQFLSSHGKVDHVYWALQDNSKNNYRKLARNSTAVGSMISFDLKGNLAGFYDNLALAKGPSFGMKSTIACPYIYLAHYDSLQEDSGLAYLSRAGVSPELIRLSIGTEPTTEIIEALENALGKA